MQHIQIRNNIELVTMVTNTNYHRDHAKPQNWTEKKLHVQQISLSSVDFIHNDQTNLKLFSNIILVYNLSTIFIRKNLKFSTEYKKNSQRKFTISFRALINYTRVQKPTPCKHDD